MPKIVAKMDTLTLQHVRRTIEAEMLAACAAAVRGTQAHIGQLEMLAAVGAELDARGALLPPPPYVEVRDEAGGPSLSFAVRVF